MKLHPTFWYFEKSNLARIICECGMPFFHPVKDTLIKCPACGATCHVLWLYDIKTLMENKRIRE